MNKFFIFSLYIIVLLPFNAEAAIYKGQKEFVRKCVDCHKGGQEFVSQKTTSEWKKIMYNNGEELIIIHLQSKDEKAQDSHAYFKSKEFEKKSPHLIEFLIEYAKDSGNIPACN